MLKTAEKLKRMNFYVFRIAKRELCKVIGNYYFYLNDTIKDFGHVIPVKVLDSFKYGEGIDGVDFSGYYSKAISKIEKNHKFFDKLSNFLNDKRIIKYV